MGMVYFWLYGMSSRLDKSSVWVGFDDSSGWDHLTPVALMRVPASSTRVQAAAAAPGLRAGSRQALLSASGVLESWKALGWKGP